MVSVAAFGSDLPVADRRALVRQRVASGSACGAMSSSVIAAAVHSDVSRVAGSSAGRGVQVEALMEPTVRQMTARLAELADLTVRVVDDGSYSSSMVTVSCVFRDADGPFVVDVDVDSVTKHFVLYGE